MTNSGEKTSPSSSDFGAATEHFEKKTEGVGAYAADAEAVPRSKLNALFENPLAGIPKDHLFQDVDDFCNKFNLTHHREVFRKGALVAQNPHTAQDMDYLNEQDKAVLLREHTNKWDQPMTLYYLVSKCNYIDYHSNAALMRTIRCLRGFIELWPMYLKS